MGELSTGAPDRLNARYFDRLPSEELVQIEHNLKTVLEERGFPVEPLPARPQIVVRDQMELVTLEQGASACSAPEKLGDVLSPAQVRTYLDCSARWWFKYGLFLPEPKTSSLALGLTVHSALEANFRHKLESGLDLELLWVVDVFRDLWREQVPATEFRDDEDPSAIGRAGELLVRKYMEEAAPSVDPVAVETEVSGEIAGVAVRGRIDLLDRDGRIIDFKTAARRPSGISPDYAFQLATYRQLLREASGEAQLDTLVRTQTIQLIRTSYTVGEQDLLATRTLYPLVQEGIRSGLYYPNRQSILCGRKHCAFWRTCEREFGGQVREA
jgi:RecB family exonuclease